MTGKRLTLLATLSLPFLAGCSFLLGSEERVRSGESSSLVDYLYPDGQIPPPAPEELPRLDLPLRVGIAFVPSAGRSDLSEAQKAALMQQVAEAFRDRPYVSSIETISEHYLRSAKGVLGMQQVAGLHGIDVMALVSYDQISFSSERDSALLYWTIVGTAFVKGNSNEVQTLIDTAVFDVSTARLLFRAPGIHSQQRNSTFFDNARELRELRSVGFAVANEDMIVNLEHELGEFEEQAKAGETATVAWRDGSGGGGSSGAIFLLVLFGLAFLTLCRKGRSEL
ncbi:MAG: rhombotarget lipoprotein [Pseudomonadota bacterium]